ncbi:MAG: hypothetical protein ACYC64_20350, partial [Armatimonadota bacterium]
MAVPNHRCFSHLSDLKGASPESLIQFLSPHGKFLKSRGLMLPAIGEDSALLDYEALSSILLASDSHMPRELADSMHCICETVASEEMCSLIEDAEAHGIVLNDDPDQSPIDVAIQIWLHDKRIIEHRHAENFLIRPCTFVYFQSAKQPGMKFWQPSPRAIAALEHQLDGWFQSKKYGRGCRVFWYPRTDGIWFMVWHGAPYKREGCIVDGEPSCICYRPERHDVLVYQPATGELQIDANSKCERKVYRKFFGRHLFGNDNHFPGSAIYTLEPLRTDGRSSLVCSDVPGIDSIELKKISYRWGNRLGQSQLFEADDVFASLEAG